ncbi:hypothetical protein LTR91_010226 [Friedmanniomyces endolithicus]|uniref:F-box domain-containing protein n=1 Tax=Friedmanniomyces endolithicus TaxID=329885 RepID=A0AAN6FH69_9PEZI|nr:hypothetical protein LTS00_011870 [Friedmanniomyces endolithicus]KAK0318346.1 hypothetical protein LTR82_010734 [Friedmanniomyces endolithicus]KAK0986511.1 hypothetical protein LTR91_010226 [Friedmanniomyces endolithicus]KAK1008040.1 hypothetical protein LTS01_002538 [Friedmanniomyces endolithicus]KAK1035928.1 hypothetical protein LTS16_014194 [Friedmanniomyces endolithicus]
MSIHFSQLRSPPRKQTCAPELPLELWLRIFDITPDSAHLWTQGRRVCKTWRMWIPKTFAIKYLQDRRLLTIRYGLCTVWSHDYRQVPVMTFDRFDVDDTSRCIFTQDLECRERGESLSQDTQMAFDMLWELIRFRYEFNPKAIRVSLEETPHVISIGDNANDTELPALRLDTQRREISFEWKGMLDAFFREAAEQDKRCRSMADDLNISFFAGVHHNVNRHPAVTTMRLAALCNLNLMVRRVLRKARVARLARKPPPFQVNSDEAAALQRIMNIVGAQALFGCFDETVRSGIGTRAMQRRYRRRIGNISGQIMVPGSNANVSYASASTRSRCDVSKALLACYSTVTTSPAGPANTVVTISSAVRLVIRITVRW